jgi:hypothetical protein
MSATMDLWTEDDLQVLTLKLERFRRALSPRERCVFDTMLMLGATANTDAEVQGYALVDPTVQPAARTAVALLNRTVGGLHPPPAGLLSRLAAAWPPAPGQPRGPGRP